MGHDRLRLARLSDRPLLRARLRIAIRSALAARPPSERDCIYPLGTYKSRLAAAADLTNTSSHLVFPFAAVFQFSLKLPSSSSNHLTSSHQLTDMQFKTLFAVLSFVAVAFAAPADSGDADAEQLTLTTHFTTDTFTATRVLQSMMTQAPFVTTLTQTTVWTVQHTVTRALPTPPA
ncbi:hypothetical protein V8D89_008542 [Ganoderma adspersum]